MNRKKGAILITILGILLLIFISAKTKMMNSGSSDTDEIITRLTSDYFPNQYPDKFTVKEYWDGYIGFFRYKKKEHQTSINKKLKLVEEFIDLTASNQREVKKLTLDAVGMSNQVVPDWYRHDLIRIKHFKFYRDKKMGLGLLYDEDTQCFYFMNQCDN